MARRILVCLACCLVFCLAAQVVADAQLQDMVTRGDLDELQKWAEYNPSLVNNKDWMGDTALHKAAWTGQIAAVRILLANGAYVNARDSGGRTALHYAAGWQSTEMVRLLLDCGAEVRATDESGLTPLMLAAWEGRGEVVRTIHARGYRAVTIEEGVAVGDPAMVAVLLDAMATRVTAADPRGRTLLHLAARMGHREVCELLLDSGADVKANDDNGSTPLHKAAAGGDAAVIAVLLDRGGDVSAEAKYASTPLHEAASAEGATILLAHGADIEARTKHGWTPLLQAAMGGHHATMKVLLAHGADVCAEDMFGRNPLHKAADAEAAELLLAHGADLNRKDRTGRNPLWAAAEAGRRDVGTALLAHGADVEPLIAESAEGAVVESRLKAIEALGYVDDPRAVEALAAAVRDRAYSVRTAAGFALARHEDAHAVPPLLAEYRDAADRWEEVRYGQMKWSVYGAYEREKEDREYRAVAALVGIGNGAVEPVIAGLRQGRRATREGAAEVLAKLGDPRAIEPIVVHMLRREEYENEELAAEVLGEIGHVWAYGPLLRGRKRKLDSLPRDEGPSSGPSLGIDFSDILDEAFLYSHERMTMGKPTADFRRAARAGERVSKSANEPDAEKKARQSHYGSSHEWALRPWTEAMAKIEERVDASSEPELLKGIKHSDAEIREGCALLLSKIHSEGSFAALSNALEDSSESVRAAAAVALATYGERARPVIEQAIRRERNKETRQAMQDALQGLLSAK